MDLRSAFSPSCTLSLHKSFLQRLELRPCLHFEKAGTGFRRPIANCCHHLVCGGCGTDLVDDCKLVDVQESSDGYVLFKFGNTQLYDDPPRFVSSSAQANCAAYNEENGDVIECSADVYRFPYESSTVGSYPWDHCTSSLLDTASSIACSSANSIEVCGPTSCSEKLSDMPLGFVGPLSFAEYMISSKARNEAFARYMCASSSTSSTMKQLPANISLEEINEELSCLGSEPVQSMKSSTVRRADKVGKRTRIRPKKPTRDLYRRSSFLVYELVFCYPFMDSTKTSSSLKAIPKERYTELFGVVNQIAIALAGSGLALVLFVASRMLCLDAALDGIKMISLVRGLGLLWLSSALQKFGSVIKLMAECADKARSERKEQLAVLRKEVHSVTFKICTMVMLSMVRLA